MRLHNIIASKPGSKRPVKRLGRGHGSGHGKTSGRGHKGQKARSGGSVRPGFEGGQMPLYRKLPIRGFSNFRYRTDYEVVNVGDFAKIEGVEVIDRDTLVKAGLIRSNAKLIKVLGEGELSAKVTVKADKFSASAKEKITAAGGKVIEPEAASETSE